MPNAEVKINSSSLENIKRQFDQDCLLTFKGYVYKTDLNSQEYARIGLPIDKEGYPTPVTQSELPKLVDKMKEQYAHARSSFIRRASNLESKSLTKEAETIDEQVE